ncbi:MAG: class I SAM-dependent RNA methyltransferase [Gemmatimonadales bacterium]
MTAVATPVTVRAIAAGGDGVATLPDGRTVFIPRAAPEDQVRLRNVRMHSRYARADIAELVRAGPGRITPSCPHYVDNRCGSCQLMHLSPTTQRAVKARIVGDALRRIGGLDVSDPEVVPPPAEFGYRSKVTFTLQQGRLGYHPVNEPGTVFDVRDCLIAADEVRALHAALRMARQHLPRMDARVVLRIDRARGRHVMVVTPAGDAWTGGTSLCRALDAAGVVAVVWWQPEGGRARVVAGADTPWPATVFEQVNPAMGRLVRQAALDALGQVVGLAVWDLYAGTGESTAALVVRGAAVDAVESDVRAVALAERTGPPGPRRHAGLVENVAQTLPTPRVILTNPPRGGMARRATDAVLHSGAERIVYVSCDPATLARDVARLAPQYQLAGVQAFDQFPQTAHAECLAVLERR